jgi:hypothetical protein
MVARLRRPSSLAPPRPAASPRPHFATGPGRPSCDERLRSTCWPAPTGGARGRHGRGPARGEPHPRRPTGALATRARRISLPPRLRTPPSVARRIPPGTVLDTARSGRAPSRSSGSGLPSSASLLGDRGNETNGRERPRCRLPPATARARGSRSIRSQPHSSGDGPRPRRCALTVKLSGRNEIGVSASKPAAGGGRQRGVRRWKRGRQTARYGDGRPHRRRRALMNSPDNEAKWFGKKQLLAAVPAVAT